MVAFDSKEIVKILPHRYPFLLIDKVLDLDVEKGICVATKNLTINEAFFQGHFPDYPIMPGVLILEAMAQAGGVLVHLKAGGSKVALLLNITSAKFRHPARPGDTLTISCEILHFSTKGGKVRAAAKIGDIIACEAQISFALIEKNQI
jgi:3-hydroxyacyl-[acyl-carrier-protein] dehydratase